MKLQILGFLPVLFIYIWSFIILFFRLDQSDDIAVFMAFIIFGIGTIASIVWALMG